MLGRMIGIAKEDNELYYFKNGDCVKRYATMAEISLPLVFNKDVIALHCKLGHPNFHYLKYLFLYLFINKSLNFLTTLGYVGFISTKKNQKLQKNFKFFALW